MIRKVLTDNAGENLEVVWDGTRSCLVHKTKGFPEMLTRNVIILNPREIKELDEFYQLIEKEVKLCLS